MCWDSSQTPANNLYCHFCVISTRFISVLSWASNVLLKLLIGCFLIDSIVDENEYYDKDDARSDRREEKRTGVAKGDGREEGSRFPAIGKKAGGGRSSGLRPPKSINRYMCTIQ